MLHFELIRWRQTVEPDFFTVTLRLGHQNRAMSWPGCLLLVTPDAVFASKAKVQLKRAGRIVGIKRAILLRLRPPSAVSSLMPLTWFGTTSHDGTKRQVG